MMARGKGAGKKDSWGEEEILLQRTVAQLMIPPHYCQKYFWAGTEMTAEICVMNRLAVVLAADSASTVSQFTDQGVQERYFKGSNKIFQLSNRNPVGVMIFSSANLLDVSWEIIIKDFRAFLKDKSFNDLSGYADEFFSYINDSSHLFPEKIRTEALINACKTVIVLNLIEANSNSSALIKEEEQEIAGVLADERKKEICRAAMDGALKRSQTQIAHKNFPLPLTEVIVEEAFDLHRDRLMKVVDELRGTSLCDVLPENAEDLIKLAMLTVAKSSDELIGESGIVFAGFGDHDIFPSMLSCHSCGFFGEHHIVHRKEPVKICKERPANLEAFAQTSMSDTFTIGISLDAFASVRKAARHRVAEFAQALASAGGWNLSEIDQFENLIDKARDQIGSDVLSESRRDHAEPLRNVLSVLPIDEMAELAETLINLQSLKEKVTKPSETVGGPVDVAVITRHEGLVWIKRKHFFDLSLNPRFALRQSSLHN